MGGFSLYFLRSTYLSASNTRASMTARRDQLVAEIQGDLADTKDTAARIAQALLERGARIEQVEARARELRYNARSFRYSVGCVPAFWLWVDELDTWLWRLERRVEAILEPNVV